MVNTLVNSEVVNALHEVYNSTTLDVIGAVSFNGLNLISLCSESTGIIVKSANFFDLNNINVTSYNSEQSDGGGIIQKRYENKQVSLSLFIQGSSYSDLVSRLDSLKDSLQGEDNDFDVLIDGVVRTYTATVTSITIPSFGLNSDFVDGVDIDILITDPHWKVKEAEQLFFPAVTSSGSRLVTNEGTYISYPKIIFACQPTGNALTGIDLTLRKVTDVTGYTVSIDETITNTDLVIFDYLEKTVTINGNEVNFSGVMTPLEKGNNNFAFDFTGTVSADVYVVYNKIYL